MYYRVQWAGFVNQDTWHPRDALIEDGLADWVQLVDDFHEQTTIKDFFDFCRQRQVVFGSSVSGRCGFVALGLAVARLGLREWYTSELVDAFYRFRQELDKPISTYGVGVAELYAFLKFANVEAKKNNTPTVSTTVFSQNRLPGSVRNWQALNALELEDGVFVCGANDAMRRGHCFLLRVVEGRKLASDGEVYPRSLEEYGKHWIFFGFSFLRKVEVYVPLNIDT